MANTMSTYMLGTELGTLYAVILLIFSTAQKVGTAMIPISQRRKLQLREEK